MRHKNKGSSLAELMVACGLFSVFMLVSVSLFTNMTKVIRKEQQPAERLIEGRVSALRISQRIRNCKAFVAPKLWQLLQAPSSELMLRDGVLRLTVKFSVVDGMLTETLYPLDYDPAKQSETVHPMKSLGLCKVQDFQITSGGIEQPTRLTVDLTLLDGRKIRAVTNLREAI